MRDFSELKINNGGRPFTCSPPTQGLIQAYETHFGIKLPQEYLALLRYRNGGAPELNTIYPLGPSGEWSINRFYYLDENKTREENLWGETEYWRRFLGHSAVPFADNGLGDQFFLDLSSIPPAVKLCLHDEKNRIVELSPSFEDFIDRLENGRDMI